MDTIVKIAYNNPMPELPEVETVKRDLEKHLKLPRKLEKVFLYRKDLRNPFRPQEFKKLEGQKLLSLRRRSKYILFEFGEKGFLSHLGMTGHWRIEKGIQEERKHDHIRLLFEGSLSLVYNDPRRFGFFDFYVSEKQHPLLKNIGPEPLDESFTAEILQAALKGRLGPVKNLLMNQNLVAGVGNIYASEVLYHARVKPLRAAKTLKMAECTLIVAELKKLLLKSIELGGSSFDDFRHVSGDKGAFQNHFWVYDREGEECRNCGQTIRKKVLAGRSTFWCANCQK